MSGQKRALFTSAAVRRMLPLLGAGLAVASPAVAVSAVAGPAVAAPAAGVDVSSAPGTVTTLAPIGGGYTSDSLAGFARAAAAHASGSTVSILVIPSAYGTAPGLQQNIQLAQRRTAELQDACQAALPQGFTTCTARLLNIFTRPDAFNGDYSAAIEDASTSGIFILGGDQTIAMTVLADTPVESAMADAYQRGVVFGGTSAGDAVESSNMIWGFTDQGSAATELQQGAIEIWWSDDGDSERGLSFGSANTILDQHFYEEGRFGRLVNAVAQSDDHFGGMSKLGIGVDYATGALLTNDASLSGVFGASSAAIIDFETAHATHSWEGTPATLSARNVLTDLIPSGDYAYDVTKRTGYASGRPVRFTSPGPWAPGLLAPPGQGTLILGGDVSGDPGGPVMAQFVARARATGLSQVVLVMGGYPSIGDANNGAALYSTALAAAGWKGGVKTLIYGKDAFDPAAMNGAAGVMLVGGDQSRLAGPLGDAAFGSFVRDAVARAPVVMTDGAMTAAMGSWYLANPQPGKKDLADQAIAAFRADYATVKPGLGIVPGAAFEPRLTQDYRWGALYRLTMARPDTIAFGISGDTGLVLSSGGAEVAGSLSVAALDGRSATFGVGTNGAMAAFNVLLDTFAPGDVVSGS
jgi:cyanophycinase